MRSATRGNAAEAAVLSALVERNFDAAVPFGDGQPYDLLVHVWQTTFLRVQCKTAWPESGCLLFKSQTTDHGRGSQSYVGLADLFGVYFSPRKAVYLVPISDVGKHQGRLRLDQSRNNQRRRVRPAADYEIDRWTPHALNELATSGTSRIGVSSRSGSRGTLSGRVGGRTTFSLREIDELRSMLRELRRADPARQKAIRSRLRRRDFYITDFSHVVDGFSVSDLDDLISRGAIKIQG